MQLVFVAAEFFDSNPLKWISLRAKKDKIFFPYSEVPFVWRHTEINVLCRVQFCTLFISVISPKFARPFYFRMPITPDFFDNIQVSVVILTRMVVSYVNIWERDV